MKYLLILGLTAAAIQTRVVFAQEEAQADAPKKEESLVESIDRDFPEKEYYSREEVMALRKVLDQKTNQLNQDIESQKEYLESLKMQVGDHLAKIDSARNEIADYMNQRDEKEEGKLKKLARFYEAMDAEQASPLMQKLSNELTIKIFDRMDTKKAGLILALFAPQKAAVITSAFPRLKLQASVGGSNAQ